MAAPTYTTLQDVATWLGMDVPASGSADEAKLIGLINRAESDVEGIISWPGSRDEANHRMVLTSELSEWDKEALSRAVCAQVEYRMEMGPKFFIRAQFDQVSGPDFSHSGKLPTIGPRVWVELQDTKLDSTAQGHTTHSWSGRYNPNARGETAY